MAPTGSCYLVLGETMSANLVSFTYGTRRPGGLNGGSSQWVFQKRPGRPVFPPSVSAVVEADTIWAVWALSDTLYKFSRSGQRLAEVAMPLPRPVGPVPSIAGTAPVDLAAVGAITQVADVFLVNGGEIAVQSARMRFGDFEADLLIMDRLGQPRLQLAKSPRLLLVDREDLYYFDDPASLTPNRLIVARRRVAS